MLTFNLNESHKFQFNMEIFGDNDTGAEPIVEFKIKSDNGSFSFPAKSLSNGVFEVSVPPLEKMLGSGSYDTEVVVILGDRYFVPLTEQLELRFPVKPIISNFKVNSDSVEAPKITVEMMKPKKVEVIVEPKPEPKPEPIKTVSPEPVKEVKPAKVIETVEEAIKPAEPVKPPKKAAQEDPSVISSFWGKKKK